MDMKRTIIAVALLAPGAALADEVRIDAGAHAKVPHEAYFGLKGEENPLADIRDKVLQYWTPKFGSLRATIAYITNSDALASGFEGDANKLSMSLDYDFGQASAFVSNETDWRTAAYGPARSVNRAGVSYGFATGTHFGLGLGQFRYNFSGLDSIRVPASGSMTMNDWYLSLAQDVGAKGHVRLAFSRADGGAAGMASQLSLGYGQALSDRTEIYALYTKTNNVYNLATNPYGLGAGTGAFGLGVKHSF